MTDVQREEVDGIGWIKKKEQEWFDKSSFGKVSYSSPKNTCILT